MPYIVGTDNRQLNKHKRNGKLEFTSIVFCVLAITSIASCIQYVMTRIIDCVGIN